MPDSFCNTAAAKLKDLEKAGMMPEGGWTMTLDMHKTGRYDRTRGGELTRSKYEKGAVPCAVHERAVRRRWAHSNAAALPVCMLDSVLGKVRQILEGCIKRGICIRLVLLDREFFAVETIQMLRDLGCTTSCRVPTGRAWCQPYGNTPWKSAGPSQGMISAGQADPSRIPW